MVIVVVSINSSIDASDAMISNASGSAFSKIFLLKRHLRMGRQGKDFGGHVSICVRRWLRFLWMI